MRKKLMGGRYLMLETRKDGTKFTTKGLKEAAERLQGISRSYDQRQHALVEQVQNSHHACLRHCPGQQRVLLYCWNIIRATCYVQH